LHDDSEQLLGVLFSFLDGELNVEGSEHLVKLLLLVVHAAIEDSVDWVKTELAESTGEVLSGCRSALVGPLLAFWVEVRSTPESLHHLCGVNTEFLGVDLGESCQSEGPSLITRTEANITSGWVELDVSESFVLVGGDDDIDGFNDTLEVSVGGFLVELEFEEGSVDFVDHEYWLDTLSKSLSEYSFGLYANTLDAIYYDKGTISNTKGSSYFRREINVTWGIDQIDNAVRGRGFDVSFTLKFVKHRDGSRFDGDTSGLLIFTCISNTG